MNSEDGGQEGPRPRGRPRKWASDAERAAAYRARKAAELADAEGLRRERRQLRRQLDCARKARAAAEEASSAAQECERDARDELNRATARLQEVEAEVRRLQRQLVRVQDERDDALVQVAQLTDELHRVSTTVRVTTATGAGMPGMNRAQRRAMKKRGDRER